MASWKSTGYMNKMRGSFEFDPQFYAKKNRDAVKKSGNSTAADMMTIHWLGWGIKDGLQSSHDFDVKAYLNSHDDLIKAYGSGNYEAALVHWLEFGKREGRDASPNKGEPKCAPVKVMGKNIKPAFC